MAESDDGSDTANLNQQLDETEHEVGMQLTIWHGASWSGNIAQALHAHFKTNVKRM